MEPIVEKDEREKRRFTIKNNRTIRLILTIVPAFFGLLGLGQIYRNYRQKRGYIFLLLGLFLFICGASLLLSWAIPVVGVFTTLGGFFILFLYFLVFMASLIDSLLEFDVRVF